jgi:hypothetical protein
MGLSFSALTFSAFRVRGRGLASQKVREEEGGRGIKVIAGA